MDKVAALLFKLLLALSANRQLVPRRRDLDIFRIDARQIRPDNEFPAIDIRLQRGSAARWLARGPATQEAIEEIIEITPEPVQFPKRRPCLGLIRHDVCSLLQNPAGQKLITAAVSASARCLISVSRIEQNDPALLNAEFANRKPVPPRLGP